MTRDPDKTLVPGSLPSPEAEIELIRAALGADYEVIEELGRGGMAVVYRARERALDRDVAIKVLPVAMTFDAELVERFQREARLSASLEHAHIVPIYRVGQSGRINFFVMKYVRGVSVAEMLEERGKLEPHEVEQLLLEVSDALDHAHGQGVVHRDIKPDNIMKDQTERFVVMDFGIAKSLGGQQLTQTGGSIGTPRYMSPEQAKGGELDGRSDFYSLGVVAYHCLAGRAPFEGEDPLAVLYSHLHDPVPEPRIDTDDGRRVYSVVRGLLAKTPADRVGDGAEIRAGLAGTGRAPSGSSARDAARRSASPASSSDVAVIEWLRGRPRRFWITAGAGAGVLALFLARGGASAQCRAAMPDASEDARALLMQPVGTLGPGAEIELSYIVCGLPDDGPFTALVTIGPANDGGVVGRVGRFFGGGTDPFRETWDDRGDGFATSRTRMVSPGELAAGSYRITLRVEDGDGRETEASHDFTVLDGS